MDAVRFPKLIKVLLPVKEQIQHATHILLNRCDKVEIESIPEIKNQIINLNDKAPITQTTYCKVSYDEIAHDMTPSLPDKAESIDHLKQWTRCSLSSEAIEHGDQLRRLLAKLPASVERLKGFVTTTSGDTYCVQYVPDDLQITPWQEVLDRQKQNHLTAIGSKEMAAELARLYPNEFTIALPH